ncbi:hypothetical protein H0H87_010146 [Tephrocybe sp. NHM501043]|nr:hypothetical protein H0H87_010146 [Tephrocybe sp. NHM501043]
MGQLYLAHITILGTSFWISQAARYGPCSKEYMISRLNGTFTASGRRQTNTRTPDHRRSDSDGSGYAADNSFESAGSSARGREFFITMLNTQPVEPDHLFAEGHVEGLRSTVALLERLLDEAKQQLKEQKAEAKAEAKAQLDEAKAEAKAQLDEAKAEAKAQLDEVKAEAKAQLDAVKAEARAQLERSLADKDEIIKLYKLQLGSMQEARNK